MSSNTAALEVDAGVNEFRVRVYQISGTAGSLRTDRGTLSAIYSPVGPSGT